jgi:hypothetical protein
VGSCEESGTDSSGVTYLSLVVLLEVAEQPAGRDARMPARSLRAISIVSSSASGEREPRELLGVASAPIRFPRSSALSKTV